jgi:hypothetical protein
MTQWWLELPQVGERKAYFDASAIVGIEATRYDKPADPDHPITIHLRGGCKIEGVITITPLQVISWMKVCGGKPIELTTFETFYEDLSRAMAESEARRAAAI